MSSGMLIALEMTLVLGGVLGLAVWELLRLRRDRARERDPQHSADEPGER